MTRQAITDAPAGAGTTGWSTDEMMSVAAARELRGVAICGVGVGLPSTAANLARYSHSPDLVLVYESGTLGAKPDQLPLSIGDGILADTADAVISVPEIFNHWLQPGRIEVGFLSAAQIDRFANTNTTVIGTDYDHPKVRLPGAGGAPEIAASCGRVVVVVRQSWRTSVEKVTSSPPRASVGGRATGWDLRVAPDVRTTEPPTALELTVLRRLEATLLDEES